MKICEILNNSLRRARYWFKRRIREPLYQTFYKCGIITFLLFGLTFFHKIRWEVSYNLKDPDYLLILSYLFFSIGFLLWAYPTAHRVHLARWAKVPIIAFHAFALLFGAIPARNLISASIGLPPEDYDLAVGIITLGFYPVAWLFLSTVLLLLFFMLGAVALLLLGFLSFVLNLVSNNLSIFSNTLAQPFVRMQAKIKSVIDVSILHVVGAVMTFISVLFVLQIFTNFSHEPNRFVVGLVYFTDYHENTRNPVVRKGQKSKIHANGIVSYAIPEDSWELKIEIDGVGSLPTNFVGPTLHVNVNPFKSAD